MMNSTTIEGQRRESSGELTKLCKRCNENEASLDVRTDQVCAKCYSHYIFTKPVKRMEPYKVRQITKTVKKLLLPLSYGPSSAALLHILDHQVQGQLNKMGRVAYELHVVHVDLYVNAADRDDSSALLGKYQARYPRHTFHRIGLEEALLLDKIDWDLLGLKRSPIISTQKPGTERLQELISSMPSATSRVDVVNTLLTRLLVDVANKNDCEAILFGDSTTRLAEKTLTQTAKGRGFSLPWQVSDGASPYGIGFQYPLRDLLKKELVTFSSLPKPPLIDLIIFQEPSSHISASSKLTTIDDLMVQYFESVEQNYPSIVANVVRTSSKLKALSEQDTTRCTFCGLPVAAGTDGIFGWGGDQNSDSRVERVNGQNGILCYGCSRSVNG